MEERADRLRTVLCAIERGQGDVATAGIVYRHCFVRAETTKAEDCPGPTWLKGRMRIAGISASDEALICRFDLSFYPGDGFTGDLEKLWTALKDAQDHSGPSRAPPVPFVAPPSAHPPGVGEPVPKAPVNMGARPTKALDDAVHYAAELLHDRGLARRKMILVISDGLNAPQLNHYTYEETRQALLRDNISVYSLAVGKSLTKQKFTRLLNYADDTGGDIYYAQKSDSMERLYSQITEEARHVCFANGTPVRNSPVSRSST